MAGLAGAGLVTRGTPATFQASVSLIITLPQAAGVSEALQGVQLSSQLLQSYAAVTTSRTAAERIKGRLSLPGSIDAIRDQLSAVPQTETLLIMVSAVDTDPLRAQSIADAAAQGLIDSVAALEKSKLDKVVASIVDSAQPGRRVGPRTTLFLLVGTFLGLLVGLAVALLLEALDRTITSPQQASELLKAPLLGTVPLLKRDALAPGMGIDQPLSPAGEAYRALRTAVLFTDLDRPIKTLLITSPSAGDGKTTIASNLAVALAQGGQRVVLVDADLRRGRVVDLLGLPSGAGLTTVMTRQAELQDVLLGWRDVLTVLGSGPLPPNPSEVLGSQAMHLLLSELSALADLVIIDGAPVLPVTDSVVLSTQVDGVILVAHAGATHRTAAAEARRRLDAVGAHIVGCVLNATTAAGSQGYYNGYGDGYGYSQRADLPSQLPA